MTAVGQRRQSRLRSLTVSSPLDSLRASVRQRTEEFASPDSRQSIVRLSNPERSEIYGPELHKRADAKEQVTRWCETF